VLPCVYVFIADEFLRLGDHLAEVPCIALRHPTCGRPDVPSFVHVPCVCVADVHWGAHVLRWGAQLTDVLTCLALRTCLAFALRTCVGAPNLRTCRHALRLHCGRALGCPTCGHALRCVGAPNLRTCLVLRLGAHLADVPCVALGRPTLVRPY
jgi:hypothetical protein